ncbi:SDR family NAD(P)-dependent oxidoreductase [Streptomyces tendae]
MRTIDFSGQTTVVTGASSGIGAAFARELARRGSDVVLVARRLDRLTDLASELRARHGVRATAVQLDLSEPGAGRRLAADLAGRGIRVDGLVNNAGFGTNGAFHREDPDRLTDEINVDVANLVDLTRAFIEPLRDSGRGVLVNVASAAAYAPSPGMAVYAACKAFVLSFTEALWYESRGTGPAGSLARPRTHPHRVLRRSGGRCLPGQLPDPRAGGRDRDARPGPGTAAERAVGSAERRHGLVAPSLHPSPHRPDRRADLGAFLGPGRRGGLTGSNKSC